MVESNTPSLLEESKSQEEGEQQQQQDQLFQDIESSINDNQLHLDSPHFHALESQILRKFDFIIIPCISLIYLFSNLDKSNIGNAYTAGLPQSLGLKHNEYGNVVSLLFVTYTVFETPVALSLKYIGAKWALGGLVFCFGVTSLATAFVNNYHQLLALRMLLGAFESGIIPIINVYLGMLYTRKEMAKRCSAVYSASALAGAFGGLLAYGLIKIEAGSWAANESWRWLFAIEGALTVVCCPIIMLLLPTGDLTKIWWLNPAEREALQVRLQQRPDFYQDEKFQWSEVWRSFTDVANLLVMAYEFCVDLTLVGISTFLPALIKGMGYNKYQTQLLTIPFYVVALISFVLVCYYSDKLQHRGTFLVAGTVFEIVGYVILIATDSLGARYFGCMLLAVGMYVCSALSIIWVNNNNAGHYKRATIGGMITTVGSLSGVLAGQIYTAGTAPRYFKGLKVALGLSCAAVPMVLAMMWVYHRRNQQREQEVERLIKEGKPVDELELELGACPKDDRDLNYRFIL